MTHDAPSPTSFSWAPRGAQRRPSHLFCGPSPPRGPQCIPATEEPVTEVRASARGKGTGSGTACRAWHWRRRFKVKASSQAPGLWSAGWCPLLLAVCAALGESFLPSELQFVTVLTSKDCFSAVSERLAFYAFVQKYASSTYDVLWTPFWVLGYSSGQSSSLWTFTL